MKTGQIARTKPRLAINENKLDKSKMPRFATSIAFKRRIAFFSPIRMGIVSLPTILSPCISRMSKNAVLAKTKLADHKNTHMVLMKELSATDINGNTEVTIPHAMAIKIVFEPGKSLIFLYLPLKNCFGIIFKSYERPKTLMTRRTIKGINPMA